MRQVALLCVGLGLVLMPLCAAQASGAVSGDSQIVNMDFLNVATGQQSRLTVPATVSMDSSGRPHLMPPHPRLLKDPAMRSRLKAMTAKRPKGVDAGWRSPVRRKGGKAITGTWNCLILLVDFSDKTPTTYTGASGVTHYTNMLFGATGDTMSSFYKENSYNQFNVQGLVTGGASNWYRAPQTYAYYTGAGYGLDAPYPNNAQKLVEDIVTMAYNGGAGVNFSPYDNDSDGYVESLFVVHAGPGAEATGNVNDIWSHQWVTHSPMSVGGVTVSPYCMEPEDGEIGVFCHEYGHLLGAWDLYDYDYLSNGVGLWSVMASGSWGATRDNPDKPTEFDAFHKILFGWVTPTTPTTNQAGLSIPPVETSPTIYKLWKNGLPGTEYFLVENRQQLGFDALNPGEGLLIYHVEESRLALDRVNDQEWYPSIPPTLHYAVAIEPADARWDMEHNFNWGDAGDLWPGTAGQASFGLNSFPDTHPYQGLASKVQVSNITPAGDNITCNISVQAAPTTFYVKASAPPYHGGGSMAQALNTIATAISRAMSGDTIVLAPGVYMETVDFGGKNLALRSTNPLNKGVVAKTIIKGPGSVSTIRLHSGETGASSISGVTLTRSDNGNECAIWLTGTSTTFEHNIIRDNTYVSGQSGSGGAVYLDSGATPLFRGNRFINNTSKWGGGFFIDGASATLTDNVFENNRANQSGGAVYMQNPSSPVTIQNCAFRNNTARWGGAIFAYGAAPTISGCTFADNITRSWGGAISLLDCNASVANNLFIRNRAGTGGGAVCCDGSSAPVIVNNTMVQGNSQMGGGIYASTSANPTIKNCIIASSSAGGGIYSGHDLSVTYCDFFGNTGGDFLGGMATPGAPAANLAVDPLFANPVADDFHLKSQAGRWKASTSSWLMDPVTSPCIDAGDPGSAFANEVAPNGGRINLGAYGNTAEASKSHAGAIIASSDPLNASGNVARRHKIGLTFTNLMNQASVESRLTVTPEGGSAVAGTIRWTTPKQALQWVPTAPLQPLKKYTVALAANSESDGGTVYNWAESFVFTTSNGPAITDFGPKGADTPRLRKITVTFDQAMVKNTVGGNFSITPAVTGVLSWTGNTFNFQPSVAMNANTTYTCKVSFKSTSATTGLKMGEDFTWTFKTAAAAAPRAMVSAAAATNGAGISQITLNLTAAADVQVEVCNIAGIAVAILPPAALEAGVSTLSWNGRSRTGSLVPRGQYLVRVKALAADGASSQCIAPLAR